jgi:hypothetical protein
MQFDTRTPEQRKTDDRAKTGRLRCIGCGKFLKDNARWNQCAGCDTRIPEDY